jgi:uncharacterized membrane protein YbaN (DUF454 family)
MTNAGASQARRAGVFLLGLACIAVGVALVTLPGPLTIPPILLGLWIWSREFEWAQRMLEPFREKGRQAWADAKEHPVRATVITAGGLVAAAAAIWAVLHFDLMARAADLVGLS